jgi:hypothetical protein
VSAHAAFAKAAHYFDVELVVAPVDEVTMEVDLDAVRSAINPNVILVRARSSLSRSFLRSRLAHRMHVTCRLLDRRLVTRMV